MGLLPLQTPVLASLASHLVPWGTRQCIREDAIAVARGDPRYPRSVLGQKNKKIQPNIVGSNEIWGCNLRLTARSVADKHQDAAMAPTGFPSPWILGEHRRPDFAQPGNSRLFIEYSRLGAEQGQDCISQRGSPY